MSYSIAFTFKGSPGRMQSDDMAQGYAKDHVTLIGPDCLEENGRVNGSAFLP